jgi:2-methylcitrate dehydratase PrpD
MTADVTRDLATNIARLTYGDIPPSIVATTKAVVLDAVGRMLAGASHASSRTVLRYALRQGGVPEATIVAEGHRTPTYYAALVNGTFCHAGNETGATGPALRCADVLVPAAFAVAEKELSHGRDVITAIVAGWETMSRIAAAAWPTATHQPLDPTSTFGPWGATAVAGMLRGFDAATLENAFSLTSGQAAAPAQAAQTDCDVAHLHAGFAAMYGLRAVNLAGLGLSGARAILEGPMGFLMCIAGLHDDDTPRFDVERINDRFGTPWHLDGVSVDARTETFRDRAARGGLAEANMARARDRVRTLEEQDDLTPLLAALVR